MKCFGEDSHHDVVAYALPCHAEWCDDGGGGGDGGGSDGSGGGGSDVSGCGCGGAVCGVGGGGGVYWKRLLGIDSRVLEI